MKIASFSTGGGAPRLGLVFGDQMADVGVSDPTLPTDLRALLLAGDEAMAALSRAGETAPRLPLAAVALHAPVADPRKFLGLGLSFKSHVAELKAKGVPIEMPKTQLWFNKQVTCVTGPNDPIHMPRVSSQLDYEGELAVVIGKRARHVKADDAMSFVAGFMICNDVSVRDWQMRAPTATLGKSFDTHGPTGPWLTTPDEAGDPHDMRIRTWVDGDLRQDGSTKDFIYTIGQMIEELSTVFTLEPGDILSTGCPPGVGALMDPPRFLTVGQTVEIEVGGLGRISNTVTAEP